MIRRRRIDQIERTFSQDLEALTVDASAHVLLFGELLEHEQQRTGSRAVAFRLLGASAGDRERFRSLWLQLRERILRAWPREYPGSRPYAWWRLEAPLAADGSPAIDARRLVAGSGALVPSHHPMFRDCGERYGLPVFENSDAAHPPQVESEATYLRRHGLLTASELLALDADDYAPVTLPC